MKYQVYGPGKYNNDTQSEQGNEILNYRSKWACFSCRKSFTRISETFNSNVKCPDCEKLATDMGYLFESPAKRNTRLWAIMELLGKNGIRYSRSGMVTKINFLLTGDNKLRPKAVEENIKRFCDSYKK